MLYKIHIFYILKTVNSVNSYTNTCILYILIICNLAPIAHIVATKHHITHHIIHHITLHTTLHTTLGI